MTENLSERVAAYIPFDRRLHLQGKMELAYETHGAALFADVSGFTPLTVALLDELGPKRGAEELTKQLNLVYDALIGQVHHYRGSVITFAGDAITCWFDGDDGRSAVACAQEMQAIMSQFTDLTTPGGTAVSLAIKVAVAVGPARRFVVGDPERQQIDALVGPTLADMSTAEKLAERGDIMLSPATAEALSEHISIREWRGKKEGQSDAAVLDKLLTPPDSEPWPAFEQSVLDDELGRPWLLPPVYRRLQAMRDGYLAEVRPTSIMFLRFSGLDMKDDPEINEKIDRYVRWVQKTLARYDGYLLQLMFGDKGSLFYATFGAPVAHEDDMVRIVAAARELTQVPDDLKFISEVNIGISQGRVYAGAYGGQKRCTYGVLGAETNIAARFMSQAEAGQILVRRHLSEAVEQLYRSKYLGQTYVKGVAKPVGMFLITERVQAQKVNPSDIFTTPLIGRQTEIETAEQGLAPAGGDGRVIDIVGQPGMGKSHFAAELIDRAINKGMRVAIGRAQAITQETAYAPWAQIFRALLGLSEEAGLGEVSRTAMARQMALIQMQLTFLNPDWVLRLPLMGDLLGLPIPDTPATQSLTPKLRQESLFALVLDMFEMWADEQPLLLLLEDIHLLDAASLLLLKQVANWCADKPVTLVVVRRPDRQQETPSEVDVSHLTRIEIAELSADDVAQVARNQLHGEVRPLLVDLVQYQSQGNPFFVQELIDLLHELDIIVRGENDIFTLSEDVRLALEGGDCVENINGETRLRAGTTLPELVVQLPDSVYASVLARIDRLPQTHQLTLKVASVVGRLFRLRMLNQVHPAHLAAQQVQVETNDLARREFVRQYLEGLEDELTQREEDGAYIFRHSITHEVTYDTLLDQQRQELHRSIAAFVEQDADEGTASLIAYHAFKGADWERALQYHLVAGREAHDMYANEDAVSHLKRALVSIEKLSARETQRDELDARLLLGEIWVEMGEYEAATESLEQALTLAEMLEDSESEAEACRWLGRRWELGSEYEQALEWIQRGLGVLDVDTAAVAEMRLTAGLIHSRRGENEKAEELADEAERIARELGKDDVLARAYNLRGHLARLRGGNDKALEHFQKAVVLYMEVGNLHGAAIAHNQMANAYFMISRWADANTHYEYAREMFNRIGDVYNRAFAENNLGQLALYRGQADVALDLYKSVLEVFQQFGQSLYVLGVIEMNIGATEARLKRPQEALAHLDTAKEHFKSAQVRDFLPELNRHYAEAHTAADDWTQAETAVDTAVAIARELNMVSEEGISLRIHGEILRAQEKLEEARQSLEMSIAILTETADQYETAKVRAALGRLEVDMGNTVEGEGLLAQARQTFDELGAQSDLERLAPTP